MYKLFTFDMDVADNRASSPPTLEPATNTGYQPQKTTDNTLTQLRKSDLSQKSLVAEYMALDPIALDAFTERAAILQYDAGISRAEAEREAFIHVMQAFRDG
ncbi:MAG: hypothetical protein AAGK92_11420 [Pseudomonadota bacterium]